MAKVTWTTPRRGPGSVEDIVSHKPQVQAKLFTVASELHAIATALKPHDRGISEVFMRRGDKLDWFVGIRDADPNKGRGHASARSMEFGHVIRDQNGTIIGYVPGAHTMSKAVGLL